MDGYKATHSMQIRLAHKLYAVWRNSPELRLGQLISCVVKDKDLFALHDEQFFSLLDAFENEHTTDPR